VRILQGFKIYKTLIYSLPNFNQTLPLFSKIPPNTNLSKSKFLVPLPLSCSFILNKILKFIAMKKLITTFLLLSILTTNAQIFTQSQTDGSITITPKGVKGSATNATHFTNVVLGNSTLTNITTGEYNVALGNQVLPENTTGHRNTAVGSVAMFKNTTGNGNVAIGTLAMMSNTEGIGNTAIGVNSLLNNKTANVNTAVGVSALEFNEGVANTAVGAGALKNNWTGSSNTAIGYYAGNYGNDEYFYHNTYVGAYADADLTAGNKFYNSTALGYGAKINASDKVRIGNTNVSVIEGQVAWSNPSDRRLKENIVYTSRLGLDFINRLQTVSYNYIDDKNKTRYDGFIAQDVEEVMKSFGVPFSGLKKSGTGMFSLAYSDFVMPLVNAVKELKTQNETLQAILTTLKAEVDSLKVKMEKAENP
jgi:hypothetical protein